MRKCIFCEVPKEHYIIENEFGYVIEDKNPVTEGHSLIIPKRHFSEYFEVTNEENSALYQLIHSRKEELLERDNSIDGFNVGINIGKEAGQTIFHCHIHLIPRRKGDIDDPTGGVRGVIPEKKKY